jgi:hypothetical protein
MLQYTMYMCLDLIRSDFNSLFTTQLIQLELQERMAFIEQLNIVLLLCHHK